MASQGYDDMGPRIDLGPEVEEDHITQARRRVKDATKPQVRRSSSGRLATVLSVLALVLALFAAGLTWFNITTSPEPIPQPALGPGVVPGGTAERVAKLDKDVRDLILEVLALKKHMTDIEKALYSVRSKAGAVTKLTELSAKLAALQDRIKAIETGGSARRATPSPPSARRPPATAKPDKPTAKPAAAEQPRMPKKHTYQVQRGDTIWVVAQRYRVKSQDLMRWNNLKRGSVIKVGQTLIIYK